MNSTELRNRIIAITEEQPTEVNNVYKESLRALLHLMGDIYYIDGNGNGVKCKCIHGNPERIASIVYSDNTLILPLLSVSEISTENDDARRRYSRTVINEKYWDAKKKRATRLLSVAPRPVTITYEINIWSKYKADLDMVRSSIYSLFSPDVSVKTKFSDYNKAFVVSESDIGTNTASDAEDRVLRKSITISLQTYIPFPKFQVTNTGEILPENFKVEVSVGSIRDVIVTDSTGDPGTIDPPSDPIGPPSPGVSVRKSLTTIEMALVANVMSVNTDLNFSLPVGMISPDVDYGIRVALGTVSSTLSVDGDFTDSSNKTISVNSVEMTLEGTALGLEVGGPAVGIVEISLVANVMSVNTDLNFSLPEGMVTPSDPSP